MEDKKLLTNEELEKVAGGSDTLDENVEIAFRSAEIELESLVDDQADIDFYNNINLMLAYCRQALNGGMPAGVALNLMQNCCEQIDFDHRKIPQVVVIKLRDALSR